MKDWQRIGFTSLLTIGIYAASLQYGFTAIDDGGQVLENPYVNSLDFQHLKGMFTSETVGMYQPLTTLLFTFVNLGYGHDNATPFHLFSLLLHLVNAALVYALGKRLFRRPDFAWILSLLFAVHPLAVEVVCWVSATSTLVFAAFFLSAMLCYDRYLAEGQIQHYFATLALFALGCFAKVQMLPFVGVMFLLDFLRNRHVLQAFTAKLPFLGIAAGFVSIALHFRGGHSAFTGDYPPQLLVPMQFMWYAWKALLPLNLGIVYDWPDEPWTVGNVGAYLSMAGIGATLFALRQRRLFLFGTLFFLGNIVLHTALASTFLGPFADRYAYLSMLGLWIAALGLMENLRLPIVWGIGAGVTLWFTGLAFSQTQHWRSTIALWTNNLSHQSATFSNGMRGALFYENGQFAEATRDFKLVDESPDPRFEPEKYSYLYTALGIMTTNSEPQASLRYFQIAAQWKPHPESFENVAVAAMKLRDYETAEQFYLQCDRNFEPPSYYMNLSSLYFESQQFEKGAEALTQAIDSGHQDLLCFKMRCFFRIQTQDFPGAIADYTKAMEIRNGLPDAPPDPELDQLQRMLLTMRRK